MAFEFPAMEQKVLPLFLEDLVFGTALFGLVVQLFAAHLLPLERCQRNAHFTLLTQNSKVVALRLLQLQLLFAKLFLLVLQLFAHFFERVGKTFVFVQVVVDLHSALPAPAVALLVSELDFHRNGAAAHGEEADVDVAVFKSFGLLVVGEHEDGFRLEKLVLLASVFARLGDFLIL